MPAVDAGPLQLGWDIVCLPALRFLRVSPSLRNICLLQRGSGFHSDLQISHFDFFFFTPPALIIYHHGLNSEPNSATEVHPSLCSFISFKKTVQSFTLLPGKQTELRCCVCEIGEITALFYDSGLWGESRVRLLP